MVSRDIIESNYNEDACTEPNGGLMENSRTPATCGILNGQTVQPKGVDSVPIDASAPRDTALTDFKVVGYYPNWELDKLPICGLRRSDPRLLRLRHSNGGGRPAGPGKSESCRDAYPLRNGVDIIAEKTRYAREHLDGFMIWELTQDAADREKSLLQAIGGVCKQP